MAATGTAAEAASEGPALGDSAAVSALAERERERFCVWERERERNLCVGERKREKKVVTGRLIEIIQVTAKPRISSDIRFSSRVTSA